MHYIPIKRPIIEIGPISRRSSIGTGEVKQHLNGIALGRRLPAQSAAAMKGKRSRILQCSKSVEDS